MTQRLRRPHRLAILAALILSGPGLDLALAQARRPYQAVKHGANYLHNYQLPPAPSGFPWAPDWSPDGKEIAFSEGGSIWILDVATGAAREVAAGGKYLGMPQFSPDGRYLVYTADDGGRTIELEILDLRTLVASPLTNFGGVTFDPVFSPQGDQLAYTSSLPDGYLNVFVAKFDSGQLRGDPLRISPDSSTTGAERPYFLERDMAHSPVFLPDGRDLLIVSNRGVPLGSGSIRRVSASSGSLDGAPIVLNEQSLHQLRPDLSRDGRIAFASAGGGKAMHYRIHVGPVDGERVAVTPETHDSFFPRFSPDGKRLVFLSNEDGTPALRIRGESGRTERVEIRTRTYLRPMATLRIRVADENGAPLPARLQVRADDGKSYGPHGSFMRLSWAGDRVFHAGGDTTVMVPAGKTSVTASRGFERSSHTEELTTTAGEIREITMRLGSIARMADRGFHGGTTGFHLNPGGFQKFDFGTIVSMAEAEDVAVVNRPFAYVDPRVPASDLWVPGERAHAASRGDRLLLLGQERRPPFFGHVAVFGSRAALPGLPTSFIGYEPPADGPLEVTNADVLGPLRSAGAVTIYVHAFSGETDPLTQGLGTGKGLFVDAALGAVDALEWSAAGRGSFIPWYALLNNGIRVTAVGGEDTIANLAISKLIGSIRTYVHTGAAQPEPAAWWHGVREGRAFVTTGPLLDLQAGDAGIGGEVRLDAAGRVNVRAWVRSAVPLAKVFLVRNGETVQELPLSADRRGVDWTGAIEVPASGWIHLRAEGTPADRGFLDTTFPQAFTNPIWLTVGGRPPRDRVSAEYAICWIDTFRFMAESWPKKATDASRARFAEQVDRARKIYEKFAEEAGSKPAEEKP